VAAHHRFRHSSTSACRTGKQCVLYGTESEPQDGIVISLRPMSPAMPLIRVVPVADPDRHHTDHPVS